MARPRKDRPSREPRIDGDVAHFDLGDGQTMVADTADVPALAGYAWYAARSRPGAPLHVQAGVYRPGQGSRAVRATRLLLGDQGRSHIRYRNGDALDLRRANLLTASDGYRVEGDIAYVPVKSAGGYIDAMIDIEDLPKVQSQHLRWWLNPAGYAVAHRERGGDVRVISLHGLIMQPAPGFMVDHRHHNMLDNRKAELRVVTAQGNSENRVPYRNSATGIRGVHCVTQQGRYTYYVAVVVSGGRRYSKNFPGTPEGLDRAKAAVVAMRQQYMTNSGDT